MLTQAARELLLLQSSDWQFLITTGTASDYAERRVAEHYAEFKRLCEMARALEGGDTLSPDAAHSLGRLERDDFCFPDLDPSWGLGAPARELSRMPRRARVLAMVMAGGRGDRLQPLTRERSKSAVPFGGRYRLIDFVLSNFVNSDMPSLYVLVQYKAQSLIEHLRLAWRTSGMLPDFFVTVVPPQMRVSAAWYRGTADAVLQNLNLIDDFNADVVAVFGSDHVYRMDVNQMLAFHQESGADVTIAARPVPLADARQFGVLAWTARDASSSSTRSPRSPAPLPDDPERALVSMGNYLFSRQPLVDALVADARRSTDHDFGRSIIPELVPTGRVFAYDFQKNEVPGVKAVRRAGVLARRRHDRRPTGRPTWTSWASRRASTSTIGSGRSAASITPARRPVSSGATSTTRRSANPRWSSARRSATRSSVGPCGSTRAR